MSDNGYIPISRKFFDHPFWTKKRKYSLAEAWIDLIQLARYEEEPLEVLVNMKSLYIHRGEMRASLRFLGARWGWSKDKVNRFLELCENKTMVKRETRQGESIVILVNYNEFNKPKNEERDSNETSNETATRQQRDTDETKLIKKNKENKEKEGREDIGEIVDFFNKTCVSLPSAKITPKRVKSIRARIREHSKQEVFQMIKNAAGSSFLAGQNQRDWQATFDWLFRPSNFVKVLEGNYRDKEKSEVKSNINGTAWKRNVLK